MEQKNGVERSAKRVGYWFNNKKCKNFRVDEFSKICSASGLELVKIDLDQSIAEQGPFDIIIHKLTYVMVAVNSGDKMACKQMSNIEHYITTHPDVPIVDPITSVQGILSRVRHTDLAKLCKQRLNDGASFFVIASTEIPEGADQQDIRTLLQASSLEFPLICKSLNPLYKKMMLIFNEEGLKDMKLPCVVQRFVNHNAVLYKLYCIGDEFFVIPRKSLKNYHYSTSKTIFFSSTEISKTSSNSHLSEMDSIDDYGLEAIKPDHVLLKELAKLVQSLCGLQLLGMDFIIESATGNYAVVDINVFPGFGGVPDVQQKVCNLLLRKLNMESPP